MNEEDEFKNAIERQADEDWRALMDWTARGRPTVLVRVYDGQSRLLGEIHEVPDDPGQILDRVQELLSLSEIKPDSSFTVRVEDKDGKGYWAYFTEPQP